MTSLRPSITSQVASSWPSIGLLASGWHRLPQHHDAGLASVASVGTGPHLKKSDTELALPQAQVASSSSIGLLASGRHRLPSIAMLAWHRASASVASGIGIGSIGWKLNGPHTLEFVRMLDLLIELLDLS